MKTIKRTILATGLLAWILGLQAVNPPTMGWSTWNTYGLGISEKLIRQQADAMVSKGLAAAGYQYINIDDGYWNGRDPETGRLNIDTKKFPNGMRAVADYIHSLGLKAGIYSDAGDNTCGSGNSAAWGCGVGFYQHEEADCKTYFDEWDYDFIKVDYCGGNHVGLDVQAQYTKIGNAIKACQKQGVVYNLCRWAYPGTWASDIADSWRTTGDITCTWKSVKSIIKENLYLSAFTGGGHYGDLDMLEMGRTLTYAEETTHMGIWCIMSSPLLIGCDMTQLKGNSLKLLTNSDLIGINQDTLGLSAPVVQRPEENVYVLAKDLETLHGEKRAIAVCNLADGVRRVRVSMEACGFKDSMMLRNATLQVDLSTVRTDSFTVVLPGHATTVFIARGPRCEKTLYEAEESWMKCYNEIGKSGPDFRQKDNTSGGCIVGNLGKNADNYMEWRNVWSDRGGEYTLTLHYLSAESRTLYLMVNGESPTRIGDLNSGSWEVTGTRTCKISLNPGFNTIRLYNNSAHMPDVDCITLKSESTEGIGKTVTQSGKPVRVEYFNMLGQPTPKEAPGMKIRRATYGDGSTKSKKIR